MRNLESIAVLRDRGSSERFYYIFTEDQYVIAWPSLLGVRQLTSEYPKVTPLTFKEAHRLANIAYNHYGLKCYVRSLKELS
jgi:hypothetical protein